MKAQLALRSILAAVLMPGVATILVPYLILRHSGAATWPEPSWLTASASILGLLGAILLIHCIRVFAVHGQGTLAPIDPPRLLVVRGTYRYTRNPMYLAVLCVLVSEALLFTSASILIYAGIAFVGFHLFVLLYEEPHLRHQFGKGYEKYCRAVPRWGVTLRPINDRDLTT